MKIKEWPPAVLLCRCGERVMRHSIDEHRCAPPHVRALRLAAARIKTMDPAVAPGDNQRDFLKD